MRIAQLTSRSHGGFVMMVVLMMIVISAILGLTYLSSASVQSISSSNLATCSRAKFLAESGVSHGIYLLKNYPQTAINSSPTSPIGPFFADDTRDSYSFYITTIDSDGHFGVTGIGKCGSVVQTVSAKVLRTGGKPFTGGNAMITSGLPMYIPPSVAINGNLRVSGALENFGKIFGNLAYTLTYWNGGTITGLKTKVSSATVPTLKFNEYKNYKLFGKNYSSTRRRTLAFTSDDPLNNGGVITSNNPGGVMELKATGNETPIIASNVNFKGTIIVNKDLIIDGSNINLEAVQGFPALVVNGTIYIKNNTSITINGLVYSYYGMDDTGSSTPQARTTINGAFLSSLYGYSDKLKGTHIVNYSANRCSLYDVKTGNDPVATITFCGWNE